MCCVGGVMCVLYDVCAMVRKIYGGGCGACARCGGVLSCVACCVLLSCVLCVLGAVLCLAFVVCAWCDMSLVTLYFFALNQHL